MKKAVALLTLATPLLFAMPSPAAANGSENAALALGAFAVFNQLVRGETVFHDLFGRPVAHPTVIVPQPAVVYAPPPPVVYQPPPAVVYQPAPPRVVYAPAPPPVVYVPAPPPAVVYAPPVVVRRGGYWAHRGGHRVWVAHPAAYHR